MSLFLIFQSHATLYEVGIFSDTHTIATHREDKSYSSRNLIKSVQTLLEQNNISLNAIDAFGVNQGPGPFTSLRIAITTANSLHFATGIPLIGHMSLEAILLGCIDSQWPVTVALLNAFNNDLYYGFFINQDLKIGCKNNDLVFALLLDQFQEKPIRFLGNGAALYRNKIKSIFKNSYIPEPLPEEPSLQQLAIMTHSSFKSKQGLHSFLLPHYLKEISYATPL